MTFDKMKPFNPWEDEEKIRVNGVDIPQLAKSGIITDKNIAMMGCDESLSVERFKSIFGPKDKPVCKYHYGISGEHIISSSPSTHIVSPKKLSHLKLWLLRWILGWRLELQ